MQDREHQILVKQRFREIALGNCTDDQTLLDVCPGGGKSRNVRIGVEELAKEGQAGGLIWLAPRRSLVAQNRRSFNRANQEGDPFYLFPVEKSIVKVGGRGSKTVPIRGKWGYCATYQKFCSIKADSYVETVTKRLKGRPGIVLLVLDELHHCTADETRAWTHGVVKLRKALEKAGIRLHILNMTGTLFRGDGAKILHVDYEDGKAITHVQYSVCKGREEGAVVPPEVIYGDGRVIIRHPSGNEHRFERMADVKESYRARVRKAFLNGSIGTKFVNNLTKDSREHTSLWLLRYAMDHYLEQRQTLNYPLQTIVVAHSAAAALGYTSFLRKEFPQVRTAVSLSDSYASYWGHVGFRSLNWLERLVTDHTGEVHSIEEFVQINEVSETASTFFDDFFLYLNGLPSANYPALSAHQATLMGIDYAEFQDLPIGEQLIRAFQADPVDGQNHVDVLVTVGKAYEGLDAPRCKHLVCLAGTRSAPWLAQCFARAWRYDYALKAAGWEDQRCWIFAPRDAEMVDAVERIVWGNDLATINGGPDPEGASLTGDDDTEQPLGDGADDAEDPVVVTAAELEDSREPMSYEDMVRVLFEGEEGDTELEFVDDAGDEDAAGDTAGESLGDQPHEPTKSKPTVKAFNIIDRVTHLFVNDRTKTMEVVKEQQVVHAEAV